MDWGNSGAHILKKENWAQERVFLVQSIQGEDCHSVCQHIKEIDWHNIYSNRCTKTPAVELHIYEVSAFAHPTGFF